VYRNATLRHVTAPATTRDPDRFYRLPQLARETGEPLRKLRLACVRGDLRAHRRGARWWLVLWADYVAWRDEQLRTSSSTSSARNWAERRVAHERLADAQR
jgi:hypothetical protein